MKKNIGDINAAGTKFLLADHWEQHRSPIHILWEGGRLRVSECITHRTHTLEQAERCAAERLRSK
jgi:hypothetical protein